MTRARGARIISSREVKPDQMVKGIGSPDRSLLEEEVRTLLEEGTPAGLFDKKRVLVLTPDATRTCPLPMMIRSVREVIGRSSRQT